jgi:hypothetical protein
MRREDTGAMLRKDLSRVDHGFIRGPVFIWHYYTERISGDGIRHLDRDNDAFVCRPDMRLNALHCFPVFHPGREILLPREQAKFHMCLELNLEPGCSKRINVITPKQYHSSLRSQSRRVHYI